MIRSEKCLDIVIADTGEDTTEGGKAVLLDLL
jgi:hypothetical protein